MKFLALTLSLVFSSSLFALTKRLSRERRARFAKEGRELYRKIETLSFAGKNLRGQNFSETDLRGAISLEQT